MTGKRLRTLERESGTQLAAKGGESERAPSAERLKSKRNLRDEEMSLHNDALRKVAGEPTPTQR